MCTFSLASDIASPSSFFRICISHSSESLPGSLWDICSGQWIVLIYDILTLGNVSWKAVRSSEHPLEVSRWRVAYDVGWNIVQTTSACLYSLQQQHQQWRSPHPVSSLLTSWGVPCLVLSRVSWSVSLVFIFYLRNYTTWLNVFVFLTNTNSINKQVLYAIVLQCLSPQYLSEEVAKRLISCPFLYPSPLVPLLSLPPPWHLSLIPFSLPFPPSLPFFSLL